jgi:hypothetical protein
LRLFTLGITECLANGALGAAEACLYVRKKLRDKIAGEVMNHGVKLQDLIEALPEQEAQKEFQGKLETIRSLCLPLLEQHQPVA